MPDGIEEYFEKSSIERRELILASITDGYTFGKGDISNGIPSFRPKRAAESLRTYRELEYLYYWDWLEVRWALYFDKMNKALVKSFDYGGLPTVAAHMREGYFEMEEGLIRYDMYDIQANSAMTSLLEIAVPTGAQAQQIAAYLESSAWRTAMDTSGRLGQTEMWEIVDRDVNNLVNKMTTELVGGPMSRADFVKQLGSPLEGTSPITGEARARMIARTEATRARGQATKDLANAMRSQGYQIVEVWRIAQNTNVCADCEALEGTVRGSAWQDYPPLHPNCDCDVDIELLSEYQSGN